MAEIRWNKAGYGDDGPNPHHHSSDVTASYSNSSRSIDELIDLKYQTIQLSYGSVSKPIVPL